MKNFIIVLLILLTLICIGAIFAQITAGAGAPVLLLFTPMALIGAAIINAD